MGPGFGKFSRTAAFASGWIDRARKYTFTTSTEGSHRAIVPVGLYEKVMPLDIVPVPLLKSLCIQDTEQLQNLGALELDAEDLGLCSFVCASKNDYGSMLSEALATIEKEG
jgi:Na+-transporting NADH:ubiquinone oxidoreductase subunit A